MGDYYYGDYAGEDDQDYGMDGEDEQYDLENELDYGDLEDEDQESREIPESEDEDEGEDEDLLEPEVEVISTKEISEIYSSKNTFPYMTIYEITRLLENRALQIEAGVQIYVPPVDGEKTYETALREMRSAVFPLKAYRIDPSRNIKICINPNVINPNTGTRWFNEEAVNFVIQNI